MNLKPELQQSITNLRNGRNVLTGLPTGFGKSLIFPVSVMVKLRSSAPDAKTTRLCSSYLVICLLEIEYDYRPGS